MDRVLVYRKTEAGKAATKISDARTKQKNPEKVAARTAVSAAIKAGKITKKPCERCGEAKTHAHHPDYSKPLDVIWLCHICHAAEHGRLVNPQLLRKVELSGKGVSP
ncbi:MAG TPA: hypothetical protein VNU68_35225 [Verrucomicrobiae bacterium]|nr:hypothetical protein [Verrucomicrobiae bacterium]